MSNPVIVRIKIESSLIIDDLISQKIGDHGHLTIRTFTFKL